MLRRGVHSVFTASSHATTGDRVPLRLHDAGHEIGDDVRGALPVVDHGDDLVATYISRKSRNRFVGEQLGRGRTLAEITAEHRWVAEGVRTSSVVSELAAQVGVETPIADEVVAVLHRGKRATDVVTDLMARVMKPEHRIVAGGGAATRL